MTDRMRVLDLFCGMGGWSQAFVNRGHIVITVDNNPAFSPTLCTDIMLLSPEILMKYGYFDVVLASPPCNCFSVMCISKHWTENKEPKPETIKAISLVKHTIEIIEQLKPSFWFLENPRGMLRTVIGKPQTTITQCQYGMSYMKPTDLWGIFPKSFVGRACKYGDLCHSRTPRSSNTSGIQQLKSSAERAKIPYQLSLAVCLACESDSANAPTDGRDEI